MLDLLSLSFMVWIVDFDRVGVALTLALHECLILAAIDNTFQKIEVYQTGKINDLEVSDAAEFPHGGLLTKIVLD